MFYNSTFILAGRAYLFKRVVNLNFSTIQERVMLTGRHMVRDVMCKNCNAKLGWMYEYATEEAQKYVFPPLKSGVCQLIFVNQCFSHKL